MHVKIKRNSNDVHCYDLDGSLIIENKNETKLGKKYKVHLHINSRLNVNTKLADIITQIKR